VNLQDKIDFLTSLGLSTNQAKVYLALAGFTSCTANQISKTSCLPTEVIYRTMPKLEEKGLAEKMLTAPARFSATPINSAIEMLLKQKNREDAKIRRKAKEIVSNGTTVVTQPMNGSQQESMHFVIVSGKEAIIKRLKKALRETQNSLDVITSQKRYSQAIMEFAGDYRKALKRGVKIRIATEKHMAEKPAIDAVQAFMRNPNFEVKYFPETAQAMVSIFDNKEAFISLSATANLNSTSSIWSNDGSFMELARNYFEAKWYARCCQIGTCTQSTCRRIPR
jgi:sugar-specific transcriptional regulator TrmB